MTTTQRPIRPYGTGCFEAGDYLDLLVQADREQFRVVIDAEGDCDPPHEIRVYFGNDDEPCARIDLTALGRAEAAKEAKRC